MFAGFVHYFVKAKTESEFCLLREDDRFWLHKSIEMIQRARTGDGLKRTQKDFVKADLIIVHIQRDRNKFRECTRKRELLEKARKENLELRSQSVVFENVWLSGTLLSFVALWPGEINIGQPADPDPSY
jgi:hypothetical protein